MATVPTISPGLAGVAVTAAAASAGGDRFAPGTRVHIVNGAGAPITATLATTARVRDLVAPNRTITVPNGTFPANMRVFDVTGDLHADPTDGLVGISWSSATSVTFWVEGPVSS